MTLDQIAAVANAGGVVFLLVAALFGGYRKWWVFGWSYKDMEEDRDFWRKTAERGTTAAERAARAAEHHVSD